MSSRPSHPSDVNRPQYLHDFEVWLENSEGVNFDAWFKVMCAVLFQSLSAGAITEFRQGLAGGGHRLEYTLRTPCPIHDLGDMAINIRVTNSRLAPDEN